MQAKKPDNEIKRLEKLYTLEILDSEQDEAYDAITKIASNIMETPIALISLVDEDRQWFKSKIGLNEESTPREYSFCAHAILNPGDQMLVRDATKDPRFTDNKYVTADNGVRFYFGTPLVTSDNEAIGTICAIDTKLRPDPTPAQRESLFCLSKLVVMQMELRQFIIDVNRDLTKMHDHSTTSHTDWNKLNGKLDSVLDKVKARRAKNA